MAQKILGALNEVTNMSSIFVSVFFAHCDISERYGPDGQQQAYKDKGRCGRDKEALESGIHDFTSSPDVILP